jgi:hypothetical protein
MLDNAVPVVTKSLSIDFESQTLKNLLVISCQTFLLVQTKQPVYFQWQMAVTPALFWDLQPTEVPQIAWFEV